MDGGSREAVARATVYSTSRVGSRHPWDVCTAEDVSDLREDSLAALSLRLREGNVPLTAGFGLGPDTPGARRGDLRDVLLTV